MDNLVDKLHSSELISGRGSHTFVFVKDCGEEFRIDGGAFTLQERREFITTLINRLRRENGTL